MPSFSAVAVASRDRIRVLRRRIAKTGVPGLGILVVPMMVLTVGDARHSAGWLLPGLCTADIFAVIYWRRHAAAKRLFSLAPWVVVGMVLGAAALGLSERVLRPVVGVIVLVMLGNLFVRRWRPEAIARHGPRSTLRSVGRLRDDGRQRCRPGDEPVPVE